eukprot:5513771-Prymnesium_polylepis.3
MSDPLSLPCHDVGIVLPRLWSTHACGVSIVTSDDQSELPCRFVLHTRSRYVLFGSKPRTRKLNSDSASSAMVPNSGLSSVSYRRPCGRAFRISVEKPHAQPCRNERDVGSNLMIQDESWSVKAKMGSSRSGSMCSNSAHSSGSSCSSQTASRDWLFRPTYERMGAFGSRPVALSVRICASVP